MTTLTGKVALVTGGSRGIGAAITRRLAAEGAAVALTYVSSASRAEEVAGKITAEGGQALVIHADHADAAATVAAVEETVRSFGRLDILVNNAGIFVGGPLDTITVADLDRLLAVDVRAVFLASQAAARHMERGGRIITIGSALAERVPAEGLTPYAMAKSALTGLTRGLARDLGARGITATLVHAGLVDTDMNPADSPVAPLFLGATAAGHYATPDDIATTVAHLATDAAHYLTGTAVTVDGGFAA
jgi:3-oxoacyl-[acyl-carrier protein] reductase